ncbi:type III restriction-modification system endonuclease [Streptococcus equi]|uniref:DEAD/DEAH box helicase family protein n=1 Tax=Streptococcus equi subsp. ruminatorum TaxID=254358 RepID=A0A6M1KL97_9STRE|nr:DEAD/DEAH box helicase family protein [Streptococcus equi]NGL83230.1 DEAD/DEAH box helicase family protein [Streptococcus equi subsp. ruminatorum]
MKLQFKHQQFQLDAVDAVADIFRGQPKRDGVHYMADPGRSSSQDLDLIHDAYRNAPIMLSEESVKKAVRAMQVKHGLKPSDKLSVERLDGRSSYNLTIEMETGTGKTYTYIRTIMELNKRYGWLKFIIVVPSVAIREGVLKSFQVMDEHFQMEYGKKPRYFVYNSSRLGDLDTFANDSQIQVMIINSQAFNATGKDARRIRMEQESFRWRKPIDVLAETNPIMIIDEPQSVEGKKTKERLADFKPLMTLRYSATHKEKYDMVYRLDAMDAYNQKLVKKIAVKAIEQSGTIGTDGYLYLQELVLQKTGSPKARIEFEVAGKNGIRRETRLVSEPFDLYAESGELEEYRGLTLSHFDARDGENTIQVGPTKKLGVGEVMGDSNEDDLRAIQIRETIKTHLEKEEKLYRRGIKVLSLFFIDEVAKYKQYDEQHNAYNGDYAEIFEREYYCQVQNYLATHQASSYRAYLEKQVDVSQVHVGYFSIDKVKRSDKVTFVDYKSKSEQKKQESNDQDAYDLIMKDKERLLSFDEPVRFIFSHSALKEGWDNPNVFQICTLKQSSAETRKRQEIGRGMRLAVNQNGIRQDEDLLGEEVHDINRLTIIANESYDNFSRSLQKELKELLSERPEKVELSLFLDKVLENSNGYKLTLDSGLSSKIYQHLISCEYLDKAGLFTETYFAAKDQQGIQLPEEVDGFEHEIMTLLNQVYDGKSYTIENDNDVEIVLSKEVNEDNLSKVEFQNLWKAINHKSSYQVTFDDKELVAKAVEAINKKLVVRKPTYQTTEASANQMNKEEGLTFEIAENHRHQEYVEKSVINLSYDLLGELADETQLKRRIIAEILSKIQPHKFDMFKANPEEFILKVGRLISYVEAQQVVQHIEYKILEDSYDTSLFYDNPVTGKLSDKFILPSTKGVYNYSKVDSVVEKAFNISLEEYEDVKVYVKLPRAFKIATPLGDYNPDWAIAFREGSVKHIYFVAETKGNLSSLQLRGIEQSKIDCARAHFKALKQSGILSDSVVYNVVSDFKELL